MRGTPGPLPARTLPAWENSLQRLQACPTDTIRPASYSRVMNIHLPDPRDRDDLTNEPLDRARLADVLGGSDLSAPAFLAEFRRSIDADVQQLLDACAASDLARVEQLAHRIEGASRVIGAGPMGQACCLIARAGRSGEPGALRPAIDVFLERKQALYACLSQLHPAASLGEVGGEGNEICAGLVFLVAEDHEFQRGMIKIGRAHV